jgi:hypothetical protein
MRWSLQEDGAGTIADPQSTTQMSYTNFASLAYKLAMKVKASR